MGGAVLCPRNRKLGRSVLRSRVIEDEIQLPGRKLLRVQYVEQIEIDKHQFAIFDLSKSLKHQVHPEAFPSAVDFFADIAGLPAQL